jgi:FtsP/CotA-like multicopper oxidase with cupredoxin domain
VSRPGPIQRFSESHEWHRYHTHYSAQYSGGAVGPIVIYGPTNKNADIDIGPVMLSDWYRNDYMTSIRELLRPVAEGGPINPLTNSNLINGKMRFPCEKTNLTCSTADYSVFKFTSGKNHLLRLMNIGSNAVQKFSIDNHTMQVIANDFMPVVPYNTSMIALGVGQRADVIVYGSGNPSDTFWLRSNIIACSVTDGLLTEALGAIYYENADMTTLPTAAPNQDPAADPSPRSCGNDPLTVTIPAFPLKASDPGITRDLNIRMKNNGTHLLLNFGDNSFRADYNDPLLARALVGMNGAYAAARNVWNVGAAKTMRAVISNYDNAPHPVSALSLHCLSCTRALWCYCYTPSIIRWHTCLRGSCVAPELTFSRFIYTATTCRSSQAASAQPT